MTDKALVELMTCLLGFEHYAYYTDERKFIFTELNTHQFTKLYAIIINYGLRYKIDKGLILWLN